MRPRQQHEERTSFQEGGPFDPRLDSRADVAMVYGLSETFEARLAGWREAGYRPHVMTGVAWGGYQDYVRGEWDGRPHYDDAQTAAGGFRLEHGIGQGHDCFYMVPSEAYARYLLEKLRRVVDAGAVALHLEEPEYWVRAGYGETFQREWQAFYDEPWQDPASSPDARYRAAKLKQHLYTRTLRFLFGELKAYARQQGVEDFRCYVPTHSLLNYAHWRIVSPESQMLALEDCDGLIAQVWTGTSRTPTVYRGVRRQRTLEVGYCEYAACTALVRGRDQRLWQLADPIEDNPNYCWDDYRANWEETVTAALLVPESERFEISPWPRRVFTGTYPTVNLVSEPLQPLLEGYLGRLQSAGESERLAATRVAFDRLLEFYAEHGEASRQETLGFADLAEPSEEIRFGDLWSVLHGFYRQLAGWEDQDEAQRLRDAVAAFYHNPTDQRAPIPAAYATELQAVWNALADMHWPGDTQWLHGQGGVGLGIADSLMFQRGEPQPSDGDMSSVYGLALPLVKHGAALQMVQLERVHEPGHLQGVSVLVLTYEGQKPPDAGVHTALAAWVRAGGVLAFFGAGDAYDGVREWWNQQEPARQQPQEHLFEALGLSPAPAAGVHACGSGTVLVSPESPAALAHHVHGADLVVERVRDGLAAAGVAWRSSHVLALRRGPYVAAAGMDETEPAAPVALPGLHVDLYDANLSVRRDPEVVPGSRWLLADLGRCPEPAWVVAAAGRVVDERRDDGALRFTVEGMADTECVARCRLPAPPTGATVGGAAIDAEWDAESSTARLRFAHVDGGCAVELRW